MPFSSDIYALVLAGGSGERFWPLSRTTRPKQLLQLFDEGTLLEQTLERLEGLVPPENILILTNTVQQEEVRRIVTSIPAENIVAEPEKRDTAPAIALAVGWVAARNPQATMIVLPADQLIKDRDAFSKIMHDAVQAASDTDALVTIGVKPTWACPSYGYIERGGRADIEGAEVFEVTRFREKPDTELAETFVAAGNFSWNAGMFIWSVPTVVAELERHAPQLAAFVAEIQNSDDVARTIADKFGALPKISIDYALMEKASRVLNIEATFDWDDVGSWISVAKYLDEDDGGNCTNTTVSSLDSRENIVFSKKGGRHIALLGVDDLIVVETDDALLIAKRSEADRIKKLVAELPPNLL